MLKNLIQLYITLNKPVVLALLFTIANIESMYTFQSVSAFDIVLGTLPRPEKVVESRKTGNLIDELRF
jgi:hypothetical protein